MDYTSTSIFSKTTKEKSYTVMLVIYHTYNFSNLQYIHLVSETHEIWFIVQEMNPRLCVTAATHLGHLEVLLQMMVANPFMLYHSVYPYDALGSCLP